MRPGKGIREVTPSHGADAPPFEGLPIFEEEPQLAVEFAPRALRPAGRPGPFVAGAWALAVCCLIGIGLFATEPEGTESATTGLADGAPALAGDGRRPAEDLPSTRMGALLRNQVIDIVSPAHGREVRTRQVNISGSILGRADHVGIALEARGNRILDHVWVDVFDPDGGVRPARTPTFGAAFDLPFPRPNGTMWVVVTAYDDRGMPLGSTRRPFTVGPLGAIEAVAAPASRGLDGNWPWRPYFERPPVAAPLPTCLPISTTLASRC